jgi:hypothetical protein
MITRAVCVRNTRTFRVTETDGKATGVTEIGGHVRWSDTDKPAGAYVQTILYEAGYHRDPRTNGTLTLFHEDATT